jgi:hypothetical protein
MANEVERGPHGLWLPGKSANPGGRPGGIAEVRKWAQEVWTEHGRDALLRLAMHARREEVRLKAWCEILDRAFGRAPQQLQHVGADGGPMAFEPAGALVARLTALIGEARGEPEAALSAGVPSEPARPPEGL